MAPKKSYPLIQEEKICDLDFITKLVKMLPLQSILCTKGSEVFRGLKENKLGLS